MKSEIFEPKASKPAQFPSFLNIKALTWSKDSHGLYDYESLQLIKNTIKIEHDGLLCRIGNEVRFFTETELSDTISSLSHDYVTKLASVRCDSGKYYVEACSTKSLTECLLDKVWLVVKSLQARTPKEDLYLKKGDVMKLGRIAFRVKEIQMEGKSQAEGEEVFQENLVDLQESKCLPTGKEGCKFCHSEDHSLENPLLSICSCMGSMKYIHFKCLKTWLGMKMTTRKNDSLWSYYLKSLECEICKTPYPYVVQVEGNKYTLIDIEQPKGNFIQLETFTKDKNFSRVIHMLIPSPEKSTFKLGRGHDADVKISDISVSRVHAEVAFTGEGYTLQDRSAKFGTLVLLPKGPCEINSANVLSVQINRTTLALSVKQNGAVTIPGVPAIIPTVAENAGLILGNMYCLKVAN